MDRLTEVELQIDFVTMCIALNTSGQLKEIGGPAYLIGLLSVTPTSMHAESYAKIVREKAFKRKALEVSSNLARNAIQDKPLSEALQQMEEFFALFIPYKSSSPLTAIFFNLLFPFKLGQEKPFLTPEFVKWEEKKMQNGGNSAKVKWVSPQPLSLRGEIDGKII